MKALVVYESQFGNTAAVARAVAEGLGQGTQVDVLTVGGPRVPGSAAAAAERRLRRMEFAILVPPAAFYVEDVEGPLLGGEPTRASVWGAELHAALGGRAAPRGSSSMQRDASVSRTSWREVRPWS